MGVTTGCGCKEVYGFPHITYPLLLVYLFFFTAASLLFVHFLNVFRSLYSVLIPISRNMVECQRLVLHPLSVLKMMSHSLKYKVYAIDVVARCNCIRTS